VILIRVKKLLDGMLQRLGYSFRSLSWLDQTQELVHKGTLLSLIEVTELGKTISLKESVELVGKSRSQLGQDILALSRKGLSTPGYFVEFGATNGVDLSNTWILEKHFGWSGILCEPSKDWQKSLLENRSCSIDLRCVYPGESRLISFDQTTLGELSTISSFKNLEGDAISRRVGARYEVQTVSLFDLLGTHGAPKFIDFLSVDTEGSEFEILKDFDFEEYSFGLICVEHNYTKNREKLFELLTSKGYIRIHEEFSAFDDWYTGA
jgi:FkbM family methyltransferase